MTTDAVEVQIPFPSADGLTMADIEQRIREWGAKQPGLLSFKVARVMYKPTCRVALDLASEDHRATIHAAFCELEEQLLREIQFDLEWMTFTVDEYPLQRKAFFSDCRKPQQAGDPSMDTRADLIVFSERLVPEVAVRWAKLVAA